MSRTKPPLPDTPSPSPLPTANSTSSFWHSQPSPLLTAHRSTRNLPARADVVIIGSGMTGASVAHHLLNDPGTIDHGKGDRLDVVMLEAREACWGATGRNGGHCQPLLLEHPHDPSIPAFELANFESLHHLAAAKRIPCEFIPQPGVRAIYSLSNLHSQELALHILQSTAPEIAKLTRITRDEAELERLQVPGALGAVVTEVAARMWPYRFVARILEDLLTAGSLPGGTFNLQTLTPVTGLTRSTSGSPWQVQTERGTIIASTVVLATNAYTSHLLPSLSDLIVPVRGQMSALHPLPSVAGPNRLKTSFGFAGDGVDDYLIQRPNESGGHLMFGGGRQCKPCVGETDDSTLDDETAAYLRRRLVDVLALPEGKARENFDASATRIPIRRHHKRVEFKASHEWTGIMGFSRDDLPWVGQVPASLLPPPPSSSLLSPPKSTGVYIAAGFTGHGMPNTWLCGASVARMVLRGDNTIHPAGLSDEKVAGVPKAYLISEERVARAREVEGVADRDWAEMEMGRKRDERPASGYA